MSFHNVGGSLTSYPVIFSLDSKIFFACSGSMIKLFSASTCERIGELYGHTDTVTSVIVNPHNRMQILSSSYDGTVRVWDFYEGSCLETYQIGSPILNFVMTDRNTLYLNIDGKLSSRKQHQSCRVIKYNTKSNKSFPCYKSRACRGLVRSPCGSFLASISKNTLFIWNIKAEKLVKHKHTNTLTSIAFSPSAGKYIATGDSEGKIIRWFRCFDDGGNVVRTTLHWHAHAVHSLAFSEDGSYLLSGGEEAVFVLWQVDTNHKQFIPRLGSTISHISVSNDGKSYALACADNTVRIIDAITSKVLKTVVGLQYAHSHLIMNKSSSSSSSTDSSSSVVTSTHKSLLKSLIIEPRHNLIVLEGMPGTLQFYDVFTDRHVMHVDVVKRNFVSRTDHNLIVPTRIEHVQFSADGQWMATIERYVDGETTDKSTLKVWGFDATQSTYVLNTRIENPHMHAIASVAFQPSSSSASAHPLVVTASADRTFKLWEAVKRETPPPLSELQIAKKGKNKQNKKNKKKQSSSSSSSALASVSWQCRSVGSFRDYNVHDAVFSADGSILAIAYGQVVTLWDPYTTTLRTTLVHPPPSDHVLSMHFVNGANDNGNPTPFLVVYTATALYVWNLLTSSVWWTYSMKVLALATTPNSPFFAVTAIKEKGDKDSNNSTVNDGTEQKQASEHVVVFFDVSSPIPLALQPVGDVAVSAGAGGATRSSQRLTNTNIQLDPSSSSSNSASPSSSSSSSSSSNILSHATLAFVPLPASILSHLQSPSASPDNITPTATLTALKSCLVYLNNGKELVCVFPEPVDGEDDDEGDADMSSSVSNVYKNKASKTRETKVFLRSVLKHQVSNFERMYGCLPSSTSTAVKSSTPSSSSSSFAASHVGSSDQQHENVKKRMDALLSAPVHALPSMETLYSSMMDILVQPKASPSASSSSPSSSSSSVSSPTDQTKIESMSVDEDEEADASLSASDFDLSLIVSGIDLREAMDPCQLAQTPFAYDYDSDRSSSLSASASRKKRKTSTDVSGDISMNGANGHALADDNENDGDVEMNTNGNGIGNGNGNGVHTKKKAAKKKSTKKSSKKKSTKKLSLKGKGKSNGNGNGAHVNKEVSVATRRSSRR